MKMKDETGLTISIPVATDMSDVKEEGKYSTLNSLGFVRAEKPEDQWHLLVSEAWEKSKIPKNETIAVYLGEMLNHYMTDESLFQRLAAFNYAMHLLRAESVDERCVKDIADISLQYVAFVPGRHNHRFEPRSLEYSAKLGESFYRHLALITKEENSFESKAYKALSESFGQAVMVMRSMNTLFGHVVTKARDVCFPNNAEAAEVAKMYLMTTKAVGGVQ